MGYTRKNVEKTKKIVKKFVRIKKEQRHYIRYCNLLYLTLK